MSQFYFDQKKLFIKNANQKYSLMLVQEDESIKNKARFILNTVLGDYAYDRDLGVDYPYLLNLGANHIWIIEGMLKVALEKYNLVVKQLSISLDKDRFIQGELEIQNQQSKESKNVYLRF